MMTFKERIVHRFTVMCVLFFAALLLRSYQLAANPLWLDELYGYQLAQRGIVAILQNSRFVPHPPLYYLLQYVTSGFGRFHSPWAWRWLSVVAGAASVPLLYELIAGMITRLSAFLTSLLFLVSPTHIYYSQESRPYALLMGLAILTAVLLAKIRARPQARGLWIGFTALSIAGVWCSYSFIMVVGVQLLYLVLVLPHRRYLWVSAGAIMLCCLPLIGVAATTLRGTHAVYVDSDPLTAWLLVQSLFADDPLRYGFFWVHTWTPIAFALLMLAGLWRIVRRSAAPGSAYYALQGLLPIVSFFTLATWLVHITLPAFEWRQFLVLLPSLFVLIGFGLDQLQQQRWGWAHRALLLLICAFIMCANGVSLQRYWSITKSPEGLAALFVQQHLERTDAVVSLHYSLDAAVSFYVPGTTPFTKPQPSPTGMRFVRSSSILPQVRQTFAWDVTTAMIEQYPRIWLLYRASDSLAPIHELIDSCPQIDQRDFPPFRVLLLHECRAHS